MVKVTLNLFIFLSRRQSNCKSHICWLLLLFRCRLVLAVLFAMRCICSTVCSLARLRAWNDLLSRDTSRTYLLPNVHACRLGVGSAHRGAGGKAGGAGQEERAGRERRREMVLQSVQTLPLSASWAGCPCRGDQYERHFVHDVGGLTLVEYSTKGHQQLLLLFVFRRPWLQVKKSRLRTCQCNAASGISFLGTQASASYKPQALIDLSRRIMVIEMMLLLKIPRRQGVRERERDKLLSCGLCDEEARPCAVSVRWT